jgi:hypothetical protein
MRNGGSGSAEEDQMAEKVRTDESYTVGAGDVLLSLNIGEGQFGTSDIFLGSTQILRASGPIGGLLLGPGPDLEGQTLLVRSFVSDVSTMTNKMSVTYRLSGGRTAKTIVARGAVARQGQSLVFETRIALAARERS